MTILSLLGTHVINFYKNTKVFVTKHFLLNSYVTIKDKKKGGKHKLQNIEKIYDEYSQQVYKYLYCLTRNYQLAEELTQETFYRAAINLEKFRGDCKVYVWLCQIAKYLYYKELKKHKRIVQVSLETVNNQYSSQENTVENATIHKIDIYQKIDSLEERTREIMYLRIIGDLSFKQIGELLQISENLARVTFYRGKLKIKEGDYNEEK